jgi:excisionase family DNA binding protein
MPNLSTSPVTSETAMLVRMIMNKLGDDAITIGSTTTGDSFTLPPHIADLIRQVLTSLADGHQVTITENLTELTPNEAAEFLNVSRMYVMKLVQEGTLPFRMVGNHHRIPYADAVAYKAQQRARSRAAMSELYALDRDNPVEGPPPPRPVLGR